MLPKEGFPLNDLKAVRRLQQGDQSALDELFAALGQSAMRTAYLITRDQASAEDAVQEAFVQMLRHIGSLRDATAFRAWFYRILVNAARRQARKGRAPVLHLDLNQHDRADPTAPTPEEMVEGSVEVELLREAITVLDDAHRVPLILRYFSDLSDQEIAEAMAIPPGTVKSRLHYARKALQARLEAANRPPAPSVAARIATGVSGSKGG